MAAMSTALTEFADQGNSRTYTQASHTAVAPRLVLQRRKVGVAGGVAEDQVSVLSSTTDSDGSPVQQRVLFTATIRRPVNGDADDVAAMLAVFRDIIAGDEFGNTVLTQEWLI